MRPMRKESSGRCKYIISLHVINPTEANHSGSNCFLCHTGDIRTAKHKGSVGVIASNGMDLTETVSTDCSHHPSNSRPHPILLLQVMNGGFDLVMIVGPRQCRTFRRCHVRFRCLTLCLSIEEFPVPTLNFHGRYAP